MTLGADNSSYERDQLVVDLQHLDVVEAMLADLNLEHAAIDPACDRDETLGLARLRELRDDQKNIVDVGEIAGLLRQRAAAVRDGWVPTIGKNRRVSAVIGEGAVSTRSHKPMDNQEPEPLGPGETLAPARGVRAGDGAGVVVGVVDTEEPEPSRGPVPYRSGHARFVSSLIRQRAPLADLRPRGVLDAHTGRADAWNTARAIVSLIAEKPHIVNLSLGCFTASGGPPLLIARAIEKLGRDVLVVAAAGNHGLLVEMANGHDRRSACWPAAVPPVVAVGATDEAGAPMPWSPKHAWVTCLARGKEVVAEYFDDQVQLDGRARRFHGLARWSGTSFAAAIVSGAVAGRMEPGSLSARAALGKLLDEGGVVRRP